jgi:hypothetical protein
MAHPPTRRPDSPPGPRHPHQGRCRARGMTTGPPAHRSDQDRRHVSALPIRRTHEVDARPAEDTARPAQRAAGTPGAYAVAQRPALYGETRTPTTPPLPPTSPPPPTPPP